MIASITRESSPAGGDLAQGSCGHAGVRGDHELDAVGAGRAGIALAEANLEGGVAHRQRGQLGADRLGELLGRRAALAAKLLDVPLQGHPRLLQALGALRERDLGAAQLLTARPRLYGEVEHRADAAAVLAREAFDGVQALFDRIE